MQHTALYRKYRPEKFDEVFGQDHIVSVLESSINTGKVSHAYLFVGSRGTGKTTVARIFAREIGVSANDMYEIDAASNRGIDDIRALRDGVRVLPFDSKYKVYIIDEVHMLSKDAWGALLKTLEEPPRHVIFILATTELQKVPETIISRCQVFNFKRPNDATLKKIIEHVAEKEGFALEGGVSELLAVLGDGSFRDALGILQKVLNFTKGKKVKREEVEKITGTPKTTLINYLLSAIKNQNLAEALGVIKNASSENLDIKLFLKLLIVKFRMALILRSAPEFADDLVGDLSEDDLEFIKQLVLGDDKNMFRSANLVILLEAYENIDNAFIAELPLEIALVKIMGSE